MWDNSTPDDISVGIFDQIFWVYFGPVVATLHVTLMGLTCFFTSRQDVNYGLHLHPRVYSLIRSLFRVLVLGCRLRAAGYISSMDIFFLLDPLTLCFSNSKRLGGYTQWVHFHEKRTPLEFLKSTSCLRSWKHSNDACFYSARPRGTRRLLSLTMTHSRAWWTRVLGVPHGDYNLDGP